VFDGTHKFVLRLRDPNGSRAIALAIKAVADPEVVKIAVHGAQPSPTKLDIMNALLRSPMGDNENGLLTIDSERTGLA
jgi:nitrogen fixation protein FixH